jgi:hypothetical protein
MFRLRYGFVILRNKMAHAKYDETLSHFRSIEGRPDWQVEACTCHNAVVNALMLINPGTGYATHPADEVREHFKALRVHAEGE